MNKKRELMASVVTSVQPTGSLTMTEYNPFDMALGLFGREGVLEQKAQRINADYVVPSAPGIITVVDADGNRCMDIKNVVLTPSTVTPASITFDASDGQPSTGTVAGNTYTDKEGATLSVALGGWTPTSETPIYFVMDYDDVDSVTPGNPPVDDLVGWTLKVMVGQGTSFTEEHKIEYESGSTAAKPHVEIELKNKAVVTLDTNGGTFSDLLMSSDPIVANIKAVAVPAFGGYKEGRDYIVDEQESRAGVIKIKSGGMIKKGDTVHVTCDVPENKYITVSGADAGEIEGKLLFIGDPNVGGMYNIEGWKVKVTPDGDLTGLIGTDFGTYTLQLRFLSDYENHPDAPYYRATLIGRASGTTAVSGTYDPEY